MHPQRNRNGPYQSGPGYQALLAPNITISIIRDGQVREKVKPTVPPFVDGVIACHNPKCLTSEEHYLISRFRADWQEDGRLKQQCQYCEHLFIS